MFFLYYNITFISIFIVLYGYGFASLKMLNFKNPTDIFSVILSGYLLVGVITVFFHFFFKIHNQFSIAIIFFGLLLFIINFKKEIRKELILFIFLILFLGPLLFGYSDHAIDANMYHHPYISYLKSEKIIFSVANIQFRFGHVSFLQYVQAALTNDFIHKISLSTINIIFYLSFILFISKKIILKKKFDFIFLVNILIVSFLLIKYSRFREYGNDLIPLLISFYFLIKILSELFRSSNHSKIIINLMLPFFAIMFVHKISYVFATFIFLVLFNFKNLNFLKNIRLSYFLIFLIIFIPWLIKNYITTTCFAYPVEITCFSNDYFGLFAQATPSSAADLSDRWVKSFITHPNWQNLNMEEYTAGFNWVPTWLNSHGLKILEIISPLFIVIFLMTSGIFFYRQKYVPLKVKQRKNHIFYLLLLLFLGLFIWFYKAPIYRYGAFYIISFIIVTYIIILDNFFNIKNIANLKFFKSLFIISLIFFICKNSIRMNKSITPFFPKTSETILKSKFEILKFNDLKIFKSNGVCFYTEGICSSELPNNLKIKKLFGYYVFEH